MWDWALGCGYAGWAILLSHSQPYPSKGAWVGHCSAEWGMVGSRDFVGVG